MAKRSRKKVIKTTKKITPEKVKDAQSKEKAYQSSTLIWGRSNYIYMIAGLILVALGMVLMLGGSMPSPDVWEEDIIYNPRIVTLAPIIILAGLGLEIYAIFKSK